MTRLVEFEYDRNRAVEYAHFWAYRRNPEFYNFQDIGGDCTNFASQCIYAGAGIMNYTPTYGWYYINASDRSPSWAGVQYLYNFLTSNKGVGPHGVEVGPADIAPGDICQLNISKNVFHHTPVIVRVEAPVTLDTIFVAAHSRDVDCRPLSTYTYTALRFVHIQGVRTVVTDPE